MDINLPNKTVDGLLLENSNDILTIRILKDIATYELLVYNGQSLKAEEYPFDAREKIFS